METQIEIMKRVAGGLSQRLQDMQSQVLSQLEGKLKTASLIIEQMLNEKKEVQKAKKAKQKPDDRDITSRMKSLGEMRASSKVKYVLERSALYQIVDEIEKWQARYDPTWILIMQLSIGDIDEGFEDQQQKLEHQQIPIVAAAKGIRDATRAIQDGNVWGRQPIWIDHLDLNPLSIPHSSAELSTLHDGEETVLIDSMIFNPAANAERTVKEVRNLAHILSQVDPSTFGLLKCRGVIKVVNTKVPSPLEPPFLGFKFILNVPPELSKPQSLRTILLSGTPYPLDERLNLAKKMASSILFLHTVRFVHKNIRPETVTVFQNEQSVIGAPFLVGFEQFRIEDGSTYRIGDDIWEHNLCKIPLTVPPCFLVKMLINSLSDRHPSRQGTHPEVDYQMQHDIYSLGVVLLEIGLWTSFVLCGPEEPSLLVPNDILGLAAVTQPRKSRGSASQTKLKLEDLAARELPTKLGRRYTDIVLLCLRCLDSGSGAGQESTGFGVDAVDCTDEDGVTIGVRYIENVLEKMQKITI